MAEIKGKWRNYVWGTSGQLVKEGYPQGVKRLWFRVDVSEEEALANPIEVSMQVREDFLDMLNQARLALEAEQCKQLAQSPESVSKLLPPAL